jgi:hypothetical protein
MAPLKGARLTFHPSSASTEFAAGVSKVGDPGQETSKTKYIEPSALLVLDPRPRSAEGPRSAEDGVPEKWLSN